MNFFSIKKLCFSLFFLLLFSCKSFHSVSFKTPVDTNSKPITYQEKQTFSLPSVGVYASNEFSGARLNDFTLLNDSTAVVSIRPENEPINNSAYYGFKLWADNDKPFYIKFDYPSAYKHRYIPKIYENNQWRRIDSLNLLETKTETTAKFNLTKEPIIVAAQELMTYNDVINWTEQITKGKSDFARTLYFGKSIMGYKLPVIDMYRGSKDDKPIIVLLTRQHPPEVTGFYAYQSFMETLLQDNELTEQFFNKYRILSFPIMNPDGVELGHWRHNTGGVDLNRDWSVYNQPEVKQTVKFITEQVKKADSQIILGLDFHSTYEDVFYTNKKRKGTTLPNFIDDWFAALEANIPNYEVNEASGNSTKPVSKGWFLYGHNAVGITYEIGDNTPKDRIDVIGKATAEEMIKILLQ